MIGIPTADQLVTPVVHGTSMARTLARGGQTNNVKGFYSDEESESDEEESESDGKWRLRSKHGATLITEEETESDEEEEEEDESEEESGSESEESSDEESDSSEEEPAGKSERTIVAKYLSPICRTRTCTHD